MSIVLDLDWTGSGLVTILWSGTWSGL